MGFGVPGQRPAGGTGPRAALSTPLIGKYWPSVSSAASATVRTKSYRTKLARLTFAAR